MWIRSYLLFIKTFMKGFTTPAQLMSVRSMVDGGLGLSLHTNELTPDEKAEIMGYHMQAGWLLFSPNEITDSDIPKGMAEKDAKTPSQRLRAVIFILWKQSGDVDDFERFYEITMETFINSVKSKLDRT